MNRVDYSLLGGLPLTQDRLNFMQNAYTEALGAIAKLCGDKAILFGVEKIGGIVSDGWISYNGELIRFVGGSYDTTVVITETATQYTFADGNAKDVEYIKTATCGAGGAFNFDELVPLLSLTNMWLPGDIKMKHVDNVYENANFDVDGYGINAEKGWRILSKAYPDTAGKVFVNKNAGDADFDTVGNNGGEKEHQLTQGQMPKIPGKGMVRTTGNDTVTAFDSSPGEMDAKTMQAWPGNDEAHNNLQPYYVILTLIKL